MARPKKAGDDPRPATKSAAESSPDTKHAATQTQGPVGEVYWFDDATRDRIEGSK